MGENRTVEATPNNLNSEGNSDETVKLIIPETESCEEENPIEVTRPLSLTMQVEEVTLDETMLDEDISTIPACN